MMMVMESIMSRNLARMNLLKYLVRKIQMRHINGKYLMIGEVQMTC